MAEDEESSQESIKFYLEAFLPYICECVRATDLLVHLQFYNKADRKEIFSLSTKRPTEATKLAIQTLLKKDDPGLYRAFKEAMGPDQADVPKVFQILSGKFIPSEEEDHFNRIIQLFMNELLGRIPVTDIVPDLYREHVIGLSEKEEIECELKNSGSRRAAWILLFYLPQRVENWFRIFLIALIECRHKDLAKKLDPDLYTKIVAQMGLEPCRKEDTKAMKVIEKEEDVLEVFVDAVDDQNLLASVQEKYDQEKSEKESVVSEGKRLLNTYEDNGNEPDVMGFYTDKTNLKCPADFDEVQMEELKENDMLKTDSEEGSVHLSTTKDKNRLTTDIQRENVELSNIDTASGEKPSYVKTLKANELYSLLSEQDTITDEKNRISNPLVSDRESVAAPLETVGGNSVKPKMKEIKGPRFKYDSNFLRGLQHTPLASYPTQAYLRFPELFSSDSKYVETAGEFKAPSIVRDCYAATGTSKKHQPNIKVNAYERKRNVDSVPNAVTTEPAEKSASAPHVDHTNYDLSGFLLKEDKPRRDNHDGTVPGSSDANIFKDLISTLEQCKLDSSDNETDATTLYSRIQEDDDSEAATTLYSRIQEDDDSEAVNDLNKTVATTFVSTDFDNIENPTEIGINLREYQKELAEEGCHGENSIIIAPTNSGKTWVACRIIQEHFRTNRGHRISKCAFVVENTTLAQQQGECCAELLQHLRTKVISGETQRDKKEYLKDFVDRRDILVVTAQVLHNALKQKEIESITKFSLIVFDECHHTQSDHPYNEIMHLYHDSKRTYGPKSEGRPQIIGLTASLGVGKEVTLEKAVKHMRSLMANLDAKALCRVRQNCTELERYMNNPDEEIIIVPRRANDSFRTALTEVMKAIERLISRTREQLIPADLAIVSKIVKTVPAEKGSQPYIQWLSSIEKGLAELDSDDIRRILYSCRLHLKNYNDAVLLYHDARVEDAMLLLEEKMEKLRYPANTDVEQIMFRIFDRLTVLDYKECSFNPKLTKIQEILLDILGQNDDARGIIFVKTRMLAQYLIKWMKATDVLLPLNPTEFVGQNASVQVGGMTKHEQKDVLVYFKDGKHKLIVATSVAEEGLDITKCNLVIRYEHVTNEIVRTQSRGRARAPNSRYYVVTGKGSPIADKEEKNALSEKLMNEAVIALERMIEANRNNFEIQQSKLQFDARLKRDMKKKRKEERLRDDEFEFRCFHCDNFICMSSDIKKIKEAHHVCIADDVEERVSFHRSPVPQFEDSDVKMDGETSCNNCQHTLGGVCEYKGIEFPLLKVQHFRLVDRNGKGSHRKKWKLVLCKIQEIDTADLLKFANTNSDSD